MAHHVRVRAAAILVDVGAVRAVIEHRDSGSQFLQYTWRALVRRAMARIHNDMQTFQGHALRERRLRALNVPPERVIDTHRLADVVCGRANLLDLAAEYQILDLPFNGIVELVTVIPEELDAVVFVRIVR